MTKFEGRCMRCKATREMKDCKAKEIKKGTWAVTGVCIKCGCKIFKIVGKNKPEL